MTRPTPISVTPSTTLFNGRAWKPHHLAETWDWAAAWIDPGPSPVGNPGPYLKLPWMSGPNAETFDGTVHRVYPKPRKGKAVRIERDDTAENGWVMIYEAPP